MRPKRVVTVAFCLTLLSQALLAEPVLAAAGDLDTSFSGDGIAATHFGGADEAMSVLIQTNGRIVLTGYGADGFVELARFRPNGTLDSSFGKNGKVRTRFPLGSIGIWSGAGALQEDDRIVVVGSQNKQDETSSDFVVLRYTKNGARDSSFGVNGKVVTDVSDGGSDAPYAVAIYPGGRILAAGTLWISGNPSDADLELARYRPDGQLDGSFGDGGTAIVDLGAYDSMQGLALQSDGKIVVVGDRGFDLTIFVARLMRYGSLDPSFDGDGIVTLDLGEWAHGYDVAVQPDGKIVIVGNSPRGVVVARYLTNGTLDTAFGNNGVVQFPIGEGFEHARAVALQPDGKIVVAGDLADRYFFVARLMGDGTPDAAFGTNGRVTTDLGGFQDYCNDIAIQQDGAILAAGTMTPNPNDADFVVVRYLGS